MAKGENILTQPVLTPFIIQKKTATSSIKNSDNVIYSEAEVVKMVDQGHELQVTNDGEVTIAGKTVQLPEDTMKKVVNKHHKPTQQNTAQAREDRLQQITDAAEKQNARRKEKNNVIKPTFLGKIIKLFVNPKKAKTMEPIANGKIVNMTAPKHTPLTIIAPQAAGTKNPQIVELDTIVAAINEQKQNERTDDSGRPKNNSGEQALNPFVLNRGKLGKTA